MDDSKVNAYSLLDSLDKTWLKLPVCVMRSSGPAAQTMGGLLRVTGRETFMMTSKIAAYAALPVGTVRKHLVTLAADAWIERNGRQRMGGGKLRRSATITIPDHTHKAIRDDEWHPLPWFACGPKQLKWKDKAVLAVVLGRLMRLKGAADKDGTDAGDEEELRGWIDNTGGEDRWRFTIEKLQGDTGLSRHSVIDAKRTLHKLGLVAQQGTRNQIGGDAADILEPNWDIRVVERPVARRPGWVNISFEKAPR